LSARDEQVIQVHLSNLGWLRTQYEHAGFFLVLHCDYLNNARQYCIPLIDPKRLGNLHRLSGVEKFIAGLGGVKKMMADNTT
jgi:hypothetical protein